MPGPFERYAVDAPSAAMRELAHVAAVRGLTQEQVAREYAKAAGTSVNGGNVSRHFLSQVPQDATVRAYCRALGLSRDHLRLVDGAPLSPPLIANWRSYLSKDLERQLEGTAARDAAMAALDELSPRDLEAAVHAYALAERRSVFGIGGSGEAGLSPALAALRPFLEQLLDLTASVRRPSQKADFLKSIWIRSRAVDLKPHQVDALVAMARALAIEAGLDETVMDARLAEAKRRSEGSYFNARVKLSSPTEDQS